MYLRVAVVWGIFCGALLCSNEQRDGHNTCHPEHGEGSPHRFYCQAIITTEMLRQSLSMTKNRCSAVTNNGKILNSLVGNRPACSVCGLLPEVSQQGGMGRPIPYECVLVFRIFVAADNVSTRRNGQDRSLRIILTTPHSGCIIKTLEQLFKCSRKR